MYIIIQHDYLGRFDLIDAMINEDGTALQINVIGHIRKKHLMVEWRRQENLKSTKKVCRVWNVDIQRKNVERNLLLGHCNSIITILQKKQM